MLTRTCFLLPHFDHLAGQCNLDNRDTNILFLGSYTLVPVVHIWEEYVLRFGKLGKLAVNQYGT